MRDLVEQTPSEQDEAIYEAWQSGKSLRVLAREFSTSVIEIDRAIDRCLPPFTSVTQMRAFKREFQRMEDIGTKYHAKAMEGDIDAAHICARINERRCAMGGWTSVNIRLDPYAAQVKEEPSGHEQIKAAILRIARPSGNGAALAPPTAPSADDQNRSNGDDSNGSAPPDSA